MDCYVVETPTEHRALNEVILPVLLLSALIQIRGVTKPKKPRNQETMHGTELGAAEYTNQRHAWLHDLGLK